MNNQKRAAPELNYQKDVAPKTELRFFSGTDQEGVALEVSSVFSLDLNYPEGVATELSHVFFSGTELPERRCSGNELRFFLRN